MRLRLITPRSSSPFLALCLALLSACGGGSSDSPPLPVVSKVQQVASTMVEKNGYPGTLALSVTSTTIEIAARGDSRQGVSPLSENTWMPIGSLSKSITATLAGILVQESRLSWNTRLLDVFPELRAVARPEYGEIRLRDLLAHQSGLVRLLDEDELAGLPTLSGSASAQRLQFLAWALQQKPTIVPGSAVDYSNGGYVAAAAMLERAGAAEFSALLASRLVQPLGIQIAFTGPGIPLLDEAWGHSRSASGWQAQPPQNGETPFPVFANPVGGMKMSARSFAVYLQMHLRALRGQRDQILKPETAAILHEVVMANQALGWERGQDLLGNPMSWHNGSDEFSYYSLAAISLRKDLAAAVLVNAYDEKTIARDSSSALLSLLR